MERMSIEYCSFVMMNSSTVVIWNVLMQSGRSCCWELFESTVEIPGIFLMLYDISFDAESTNRMGKGGFDIHLLITFQNCIVAETICDTSLPQCDLASIDVFFVDPKIERLLFTSWPWTWW